MSDKFEKGKHYVFSIKKFKKDMGHIAIWCEDFKGVEIIPKGEYTGYPKSDKLIEYYAYPAVNACWCTEVKQNYKRSW